MRVVGILLALCFAVHALDDVAVTYTFSDSGIIYASEHNANFDTLESRINQLNDSLDLKWIRFTDLTRGDSTLSLLKVDTIRSNPVIDSIQGLNVMRGNPNIDSISGGLYYSIQNIAGLATLRGNPNVDSISGGTYWATSRIDADSVWDNPVLGGRITVPYADIDTIKNGVAIYGADPRATASTTYDDVVVSATGNAGISIIASSGIGSTGVAFGDSLDPDRSIVYATGGNHASTPKRLVVVSNGATAMVFDSLGKVGVNTGTPSARLQVKGSVVVDTNLVADSIYTESIKVGTLLDVATTTLSASAGIFSNDVSVADSLYAERIAVGYEEVVLNTKTLSVTESYVRVMEGAKDTVETISGHTGYGAILILTKNSSGDIKIVESGNINLPSTGTITMGDDDQVMLIYGLGNKWHVVSVSDN